MRSPCPADFAAAYSLNRQLNELLFDSLRMDPPSRAALGSAPFAVLKQLKYAPAGFEEGRDRLSNASLGAGAHADWGSLTVLATDGTPGLQVELDGEWLPVPPKEGCLIVNAGDQIEMVRAPPLGPSAPPPPRKEAVRGRPAPPPCGGAARALLP